MKQPRSPRHARNLLPKCGKPHPTGAAFCPACGTPTPLLPGPAETRLVRPRQPRMLAGVCSGIAIHFGWDITLVRILYAVFCCLTFFTGVLLYLAAGSSSPKPPTPLPPAIVNP